MDQDAPAAQPGRGVLLCCKWTAHASGRILHAAVTSFRLGGTMPLIRRLAAIGALALALILAGCSSTTGGKPAEQTTSTSSAPPSTSAAAEPVTDEPSPSYETPTVHDFRVTLKILSKQCFGDAGCNLTYKPVLTVLTDTSLFDPSATFDVTYVVKGGDSGPVTDTLTVTGDQYEGPSEQVIGTASQRTKLTVSVTDVSPE